MAELDEVKDTINNIRLYMTMCLALIISIGSGITNMYMNDTLSYLFFLGNILLLLLLIVFIFLVRALHIKTDKLKDIK
jgi:membrane protein YdbS with pleckstrin-like domain